MKLCPDDPRLTAFVLGELDPKDAAQVEEAVLADPDLQAAVSELRGLQENLVFELVVEPELELTRDQHKEVLASGRSSLMASKEIEEREREDAMAAGILEAITKKSIPAGGSQEEGKSFALGTSKVGTFLIIAMSGAVAACVAVGVSWFISWKSGVDRHLQEAEFFEKSDVPGFEEVVVAEVPRQGRGEPKPERIVPPTAHDWLEPGGAGDGAGGGDATDSPVAAEVPSPGVPEIPRLQEQSMLWGAPAGKSLLGPQFPHAQRNPSDRGSRIPDAVPEPPEGFFEESLEAVDGDSAPVGGSHTIEMPYQWTREFFRSYIPTEIDTVSYSNVRRYLREGISPPTDSVHIEEMINFFDYDFKPSADGIFGVDVERAVCPWQPEHQLVRVAVHASAPDGEFLLAPRNYVFLIDSSVSMRTPARLGMLSESAGQLVETLSARDKITIFTYEGDSARLVAGPLTGNRKDAIRYAFLNLDRSRKLTGTPIRIAFRAARNSFITQAENRVVVVTDKNIEAGAGSPEALANLAKLGNDCNIGLTAAAVGGGVLDSKLLAKLETEANAQTHYLDGAGDASRFFGKALAKPAILLANSVAIDVDFNSEIVRSYRLIGFANRPVDATSQLPRLHADVRDGYALTALYEVIPLTAPVKDIEIGSHGGRMERETDRLLALSLAEQESTEPFLKVRLRYDAIGVKLPKHTVHRAANEAVLPLSAASPDFQFAAAVAGYGMLLRESPYRGQVNSAMVRRLSEAGLAFDPYGLRREFVELVRANTAVLP